MSAKKVRSSVDYGALAEMVASEKLRWPTVSVAARGIKVEADANAWMILTGKKSSDPFWLADRIIEYGEAIEEVSPLWERFQAGEIEAMEFERALDGLVTRMEEVFEHMQAGPSDGEATVPEWARRAEP